MYGRFSLGALVGVLGHDVRFGPATYCLEFMVLGVDL